jgi:hypothetical protein
VYVSFDDGENWQSLKLNMPPTSIRDLVIKDDDLVIGTHGRGFWILDDITPLRQISNSLAAEKAILYKPQNALRIRWNMNTDTPIPQEEPGGQNPPDGAVIDYYLSADAESEVTIEIVDASGRSIRKYSSNDKPYAIPPSNVPDYWVRPQQILSNAAGSHRFLWDMHYTPLDEPVSFPMTAIYLNTAPEKTSPWVLPGNYSVKLTVNGKTYTQPLTVKMDPRVKTTVADLQKQHALSLTCYEGRLTVKKTMGDIADARKKLSALIAKGGTNVDALKTLDQEVAGFESARRGRRGGGPPAAAQQGPTLGGIDGAFNGLAAILHENDMPPTKQTTLGVKETQSQLMGILTKWDATKAKVSAAMK